VFIRNSNSIIELNNFFIKVNLLFLIPKFFRDMLKMSKSVIIEIVIYLVTGMTVGYFRLPIVFPIQAAL